MKKKKPLANRIEQAPQSDGILDSPEEFVPGLIKEIQENLDLPEVNLSSKESAAEAAHSLAQKVEKLKDFQHRVQSLKSVLIEKRDELESEKKTGEDILD